MPATYSTQLTFQYDDMTTRNLNFDDVNSESIATLKGKILEFNEALATSGDEHGDAYKDTFTSDDGSPLNKISKAKYTVTEEQVIYNGD